MLGDLPGRAAVCVTGVLRSIPGIDRIALAGDSVEDLLLSGSSSISE